GTGGGPHAPAGGGVTEATPANLFLVERGQLVTPAAAGNLLGGVTRDLVLRLARRAGLVVREERVAAARLRRADEVFLTASTIEIMPVVRLDGRRVATGRPGPITQALQAAYRAAVGVPLSHASGPRARIAGSR